MRQQEKMNALFAEFEGRLLDRRAEIVSELHAQMSSTAPMLRVRDADQSRVLHDRFVAERLNSLAHERLGQVEAALARLHAGKYGTCADCGHAISARRLAAIPWAERCIACEEALGTPAPPDQQLQPAA